jgi:hypothetical protein
VLLLSWSVSLNIIGVNPRSGFFYQVKLLLQCNR